jgi:hypothetical protein
MVIKISNRFARSTHTGYGKKESGRRRRHRLPPKPQELVKEMKDNSYNSII